MTQQCDGQCDDCDFADWMIDGEWREIPVCLVATGQYDWDDYWASKERDDD